MTVKSMPIKIVELSKRYRKGFTKNRLAVDRLDLSIRSGEIFGFLGPNGAGKSTVIKILMNFIKPDVGSALINGIPVSYPSARKSVGYLPENPYFYDHLTSEEILSFGGRAAGMDGLRVAANIDRLLDLLKLSHVKRQSLRTFSKGMVQRIGLALSLIHDPEICILDEPMSGLDPLGRRLVTDIILEMRKQGTTVFFSSHILSDIERICDRVGILNRGRLLFCGAVKELNEKQMGLENAFIKLIEKDETENHAADLVVGKNNL